MREELLSPKRVCVQAVGRSFIVAIDTQAVLRCVVRRDALRYAVMIRRALRRGTIKVAQ